MSLSPYIDICRLHKHLTYTYTRISIYIYIQIVIYTYIQHLLVLRGITLPIVLPSDCYEEGISPCLCLHAPWHKFSLDGWPQRVCEFCWRVKVLRTFPRATLIAVDETISPICHGNTTAFFEPNSRMSYERILCLVAGVHKTHLSTGLFMFWSLQLGLSAVGSFETRFPGIRLDTISCQNRLGNPPKDTCQ